MKRTLPPLIRSLKFLLILGALFSLISFLSLTFLINHYFSKSEINYLVTGQLQDFFSRPVKLSSVQLDMSGSLKIKGLKIYRRNSVNFFIKSDYLLIKYSVLNLLKGDFRITDVKFISPAINLVKDKGGEWNFYDILEKYKNRKKSGKISLVGFAIEDGKISVKDESKAYSHSFDHIDFRTGDIGLSDAITFNFSTFFKSDYLSSTKPGRIYLEGVFRPENMDVEKASIKEIRAEISVNEINFHASGELLNLKDPEAFFSVEIPKVNLKKVFKLKNDLQIPASKAEIKLRAEEDGKYYAEGRIDSLKAALTSSFGYHEGKMRYSADIRLSKVNAEKINFILDKHIKNAKGEIDIQLLLEGLLGAKPEKMHINSQTAALSFKDPLKSIDFANLSGKMLITDAFQALNATGGSASFPGNSADRINFKWEKENNLEKFLANFRLNSGKVRAKGSLKRAGAKILGSELTIYNEKTDVEKIAEMFSYFGEKIRTAAAAQKNPAPGKYNFIGTPMKILYKSKAIDNEYGTAEKIYSYSEISDLQSSFAETSGTFRIKLINGRFYDIQKNAEKNKFYYLISLPITTLFRLNRFGALKIQSELKNMDFQEVGADYSLNNGKMIINSFYINGKDFLAYTRGNIDLGAERLDLTVYTVNSKYHSMGGLPESLTDAKGRPALAFKLKGKFKSNDIKILDPNYNVNIIQEAIKKGVDIDVKKMDAF